MVGLCLLLPGVKIVSSHEDRDPTPRTKVYFSKLSVEPSVCPEPFTLSVCPHPYPWLNLTLLYVTPLPLRPSGVPQVPGPEDRVLRTR